MQLSIAKEFQLGSKESIKERESEFMEWHFHGATREKTLKITRESLIITCTTYKEFEGLKKDFFDVLSPFYEAFSDAQGTRLGLRYINEITVPDDNDVFAWENYFHEKMLCLFNFVEEKDKKTVSRMFQILEYNFNDFNLKYQFGMHNADFPAPIRIKSFILDLDAYRSGPLEKNDVLTKIDSFHYKIQELFEYSIGSRLKEIMNAG